MADGLEWAEDAPLAAAGPMGRHWVSRNRGKMNIILAGVMGRYPYGGVAWCSLMYLLGLRKLGHRVWYLEDTGECNYDPAANSKATDPKYALDFIRNTLSPHELGERWCYVDYAGKHHGHSRETWRKICRDADLFLDLSGGCWFWRDEYASIPFSAFIDSDPGFTQLAIAEGVGWYVDFFSRFNTLFTFGRNIGTPHCPVPTGRFRWEHTWEPVCMEQWSPTLEPPRPCFTTVMTWKIESFGSIGGNKDQEFLKILDLPSRTSVPVELAVNGPQDFLRGHGWSCRDAFAVSSTAELYRDYVRSSYGEFSVAKHTYVSTNSGWFSDRTECYLASGRPAVVQDTGFSEYVPTGDGLLAFRTADAARAHLEAIKSNYAHHSRAARELAEAHFSAEVVLPDLLEKATVRRGASAVAEAG
jgi:hypothetical protein